jgi:hypothetical protein
LDKETCWELVTKIQHIIDVETFYNTEETIDEESSYKKYDHQDFWNDFNCL